MAAALTGVARGKRDRRPSSGGKRGPSLPLVVRDRNPLPDFWLTIYPPIFLCKCGFQRTLSAVFLEVRILNELGAHFS